MRTVGGSREAVATIGGLRVQPDLALDDLRPQDSSLLILGGADLWDSGSELAPFARLARRFLDAGTPVAAICGAVLREPLPVAGIARAMGITRQSVQRVADLLAERGLAEYVPNPAHRRAKLLRPTAQGRAAVAEIDPGHADLADRLAGHLGDEAFAETVRVLERLSAAMDEVTGR
ncbi:MarR family transcriptional regulator [Streptomyces sp. NPDC091292]|uniref:MarR family transcriptional regulator n=1 Tax=Streptomyces sp. NPDC091292 TaxID=3365991 RepID=UPI00382FFB7A